MDFSRPLADKAPPRINYTLGAHASLLEVLVQGALVDGAYPHRRRLTLYGSLLAPDPAGGRSPRRSHLECPPWAEIRRNDARRTGSAVGRLMEAGPDRDGRIILPHGPAGTGKTTTIRALAREWEGRCSIEVVTDPERLFGDPGYLTELLGARSIVSLLAGSPPPAADPSDAWPTSPSSRCRPPRPPPGSATRAGHRRRGR